MEGGIEEVTPLETERGWKEGRCYEKCTELASQLSNIASLVKSGLMLLP